MAVRLRECVAVRGCVSVWCKAVRTRECGAVWVRVAWLCGYVSAWRCECVLHGCAVT